MTPEEEPVRLELGARIVSGRGSLQTHLLREQQRLVDEQQRILGQRRPTIAATSPSSTSGSAFLAAAAAAATTTAAASPATGNSTRQTQTANSSSTEYLTEASTSSSPYLSQPKAKSPNGEAALEGIRKVVDEGNRVGSSSWRASWTRSLEKKTASSSFSMAKTRSGRRRNCEETRENAEFGISGSSAPDTHVTATTSKLASARNTKTNISTFNTLTETKVARVGLGAPNSVSSSAAFAFVEKMRFAVVHPKRDRKNRRILTLFGLNLMQGLSAQEQQQEQQKVHKTKAKRNTSGREKVSDTPCSTFDHTLMYALYLVQALAHEPFIIVHVHDGMREVSSRYLNWLHKFYKLIPTAHLQSVVKVLVLTSSRSLRSRMWLARPFTSSRLWKKLEYVHSTSKLVDRLGCVVNVPDAPVEADAEVSSPGSPHSLSGHSNILTSTDEACVRDLFRRAALEDEDELQRNFDKHGTRRSIAVERISLADHSDGGHSGRLTLDAKFRRDGIPLFQSNSALSSSSLSSPSSASASSASTSSQQQQQQQQKQQQQQQQQRQHGYPCPSTQDHTNPLAETLELCASSSPKSTRTMVGVEMLESVPSFESPTSPSTLRPHLSCNHSDSTLTRGFVETSSSLTDYLGSAVFGVPLFYLAQRSSSGVPEVVQDCVEAILRHGPTTEGIFRIPGDEMVVDFLKVQYNQGYRPVAVSPATTTTTAGIRRGRGGNGELKSTLSSITPSVHAVASLLKAFFRELPEPIVPQNVYSQVLLLSESISDMTTLAYQIGDRMISMPQANFEALGYLMHFLCHISIAWSSTSKMTLDNLTIVWAPNILSRAKRSSTNFVHKPIGSGEINGDMLQTLADLPSSVKAVKCMIQHADIVFPQDMLALLPPTLG